MHARTWPTDLDAEFNRLMAEESRQEAIKRAQEMAREAGPPDDDEAVTDYRNRRGE